MELAGFVGPSYVSQSPIADAEETINWYMEPVQAPSASARSALYPTPGVQTLGMGEAGPGRANFFLGGRQFAVIGAQFGEINSPGTLFTAHGSVATDGNPATISSNGDGGGQLFITSGGNGYLFELATDTFSTIAFLAGKATMGDALDGYFLALDADNSTLYISDLLDGATWDPTQFAQRSIAPDPWVSMKVANRYIYLLGSETSEVWYDAGAFPFPFQPHPSGSLIQYGCAAPFSPEVLTGSLVWVASTVSGQGTVLRISGFTPEPISTYPLQVAFNSYTTIADGIGDTYDDLGHTFYILTFPTADVTWCWDAQVGVWHRRGTWVAEQNIFQAWRPLFHAFAFGEHRMLDRDTAAIYRMSSDIYTDVPDSAGDPRELRRLRRAPALVSENERVFFAYFELYMETGLGATTGQGSDPQVMLRMSNDGGKTWGPEQWRSAGARGEYGTRVRWLRCGSARKRVFEVVVSDPIPWRILGAFVELADFPQAQRGAA